MDEPYNRKAFRTGKKSRVENIVVCSTILIASWLVATQKNAVAVTVTVDAGDVIRDDISPKTFASGVQHEDPQFNQLMGSLETPNAAGRNMVLGLNLGGMRFPMGTSAQYYYWDHPSWSYPGAVSGNEVISPRQQQVPEWNGTQNVLKTYDGMYKYIAELGMDPLFQVNSFSSIDTATNIHYVNPTGVAPGVIDNTQLNIASTYAADWVSDYQSWRSSEPAASPDQFWEVGNEDWSWWKPQDYATIFGQYAAKMKARKADIKLLAQTLTHPWTVGSGATKIINDDTWTTTFAQSLAAGGTDLRSVYALSYHQYFSSPVKPALPVNFSFENPDVRTGISSHTICNGDARLNGSGWTFTSGSGWDSAGIAGGFPNEGSVWNNAVAPHGRQVALIQGKSTIESTQPLSLQYGVVYTITVQAARRPGNPVAQTVHVTANGASVGDITPTTDDFQPYLLAMSFAGSGPLPVTFKFAGTVNADATVFLDDITITDRPLEQYRRDQTRDMLSQVSQASELNGLISKVKSINSANNVGWKIWATEFNQQQEEPTSPIGITNAQDIGQGVVIADWVGRMLELGVERVVMHSLDQHPCFSIIEYANNGSSPTSPMMSVPGYAYSIFPQKFGSAMVKVSYTANPLVNGAPQLAVYASLTKDRSKLRLIAINRDLDNAAALSLETANAVMGTSGATYQQLSSPYVSDNNSNHTHTIAWSAPAAFSNGQNVPPHSITFVEIPLQAIVAQPANFSFEEPALSPASALSNGALTGAGWTFTGGGAAAGIAANGSAWSYSGTPANLNAPDGTQVGVIQNHAGVGQSLNWQANTSYWITVSAAQRLSNTGSQSVDVIVGSATVGSLTSANVPRDGLFHTCTFGPFTPASGSSQLLFQGTGPTGAGNDNTMFLDNIKIKAITNGDHTLSPLCAPGSRLDALAGSAANGTKVQIWTANGSPAQKWTFTNMGSNQYRIAAAYTTSSNPVEVLDVAGWSSANGTKVQLWQQGVPLQNNQRWIPSLAAGGFVFAAALAPGSCLDVLGGGTADGTQAQIWQASPGASNQIWTVR
jgi:hypothetical protein